MPSSRQQHIAFSICLMTIWKGFGCPSAKGGIMHDALLRVLPST